MYENFGGLVDQTAKTVTFRLFVPDGERAPFQYDGGGLPRLTGVFVVGSFQNLAPKAWDLDAPIPMAAQDYRDDGVLKGTVYEFTTGILPDGFYEYKYLVRFENGTSRLLTDPCGRWGGMENQNSGFVVGGAVEDVEALANRLPYQDLIVYELMIDDFTSQYKDPNESPLGAVVHKLDELVALGVNAIEFMPWLAWTYSDDANTDFSWGYNPIQYFSVAHKYTLKPANDTDKLVHLKRLITECHRRNLHVIMDGVFNHADAIAPDRGFPYYWLYEDPADSPYVGNFAQAAYFRDLDYANRCVLEYIRDACIYWMDVFKIDGIRLDNTLGYYKPDDRGQGLPKLLSELRAHLSRTNSRNFSFILEHSWDYEAINVTNRVGATSCWFDPYRSRNMDYLANRPNGVPQVETELMRLLDAGRDFDPGRTATCYIENHDHKRFMLKAGGRPFWYFTQPYVVALFTSPGAILIYNGQEFGLDNDMPEDGAGRVVPRPLDWAQRQVDPGPSLVGLYQTLMRIRRQHPGLRSANFYPTNWDESQTSRNSQGFGIDRSNNIVVYHRWGPDDAGRVERFYIILNYSQMAQPVSFEVASPGQWTNLLDNSTQNAVDGRLTVNVGSNWGAIFFKAD
jgi:1,4-alpha-glucan branching enzyme